MCARRHLTRACVRCECRSRTPYAHARSFAGVPGLRILLLYPARLRPADDVVPPLDMSRDPHDLASTRLR
ncbi:hypothetical protein C7S17_6548 [Burkholderia thailandensis]|nr:hypothetical protein [Burkholderia thailandensis]